jgi:hypothetical protein
MSNERDFITSDLQPGRNNNDFAAVIPPEGARTNNVGAGGLACFHESARRDLVTIEEMRAQAAARNVRIVGEGWEGDSRSGGLFIALLRFRRERWWNRAAGVRVRA